MQGKETVDFQAVFDIAPSPFLLLTPDFTIAEVNQAYNEINQNAKALVGQSFFEAFPNVGESGRVLLDSLERVRATCKPDFISALPVPSLNGLVERYLSCSHLPILDKDGALQFILQQCHDITLLHKRGDQDSSPLSTAVLRRAEKVQALNSSLLEESTHLHNLFMQAPSFMCVLRGPDLQFDLANSAFLTLIGFRDIAGQPIREAIPELNGQTFLLLLEQVFKSGAPFVGKQMKVEFQRLPGEKNEEFYVNFVFQPIFGRSGEVTGIFIDGNDVTGHVKAEKSQALLVRELHHRVRNTLATVQGVMNSTARTAETIEDYQWAFSGRISSLARTHALLTEEIQQFVSFPHLLRQEIGIYSDGDTGRVALEGPDVELPSQLAVPLGMTIHELTTNAFRHGALSTQSGHVSVTWSVKHGHDKRILICRWLESGGPTVSPPVRHGFGSMILTRVLAQQIGAKVDVNYSPSGFDLAAEIPLDIERV